jgi:succinoglycan biosynthesis protein ExoM
VSASRQNADAERGTVPRVRDVTVAVLTYRRSGFLPDLVADLDREATLAANEQRRVALLVVDNDPDGSAGPVVRAQRPAAPLRYVVEPRRGIAAARNRVLAECADSDVLVFLDDDERPDPGWLGALLSTYESSSPAAVSGPVRTEYLTDPHPWAVAGRFVDRSYRDGLVTGAVVAEAATNNLLLDLGVVRTLGLTFDESLQLSGGEDAIFTRRLTAAGERIVWCAEARVTDLRPGHRTTRAALLRRTYSLANGKVVVGVRLADGRLGRARVRLAALAGGVARLGAGGGSFLLGCVTGRMDRRANGARLVARGVGAVSGGLGHRYETYRTVEPTSSLPGDD